MTEHDEKEDDDDSDESSSSSSQNDNLFVEFDSSDEGDQKLASIEKKIGANNQAMKNINTSKRQPLIEELSSLDFDKNFIDQQANKHNKDINSEHLYEESKNEVVDSSMTETSTLMSNSVPQKT